MEQIKYDRKWWLIPIILLVLVVISGYRGTRFIFDPREMEWSFSPSLGFLQVVMILGVLDIIILKIYREMADRPFVEITAWWLSMGILTAWFGFVSPGVPQTEFETVARFACGTILVLKCGMIFISQL